MTCASSNYTTVQTPIHTHSRTGKGENILSEVKERWRGREERRNVKLGGGELAMDREK